MSTRRRPPARFPDLDAPGADLSELQPVSPLPRPLDAPVRAGGYGLRAHVPTAAYVAPLPSEVDPTSTAQFSVRSADPLAFLAAQARASVPEAPADPTAPTERRFGPSSRHGRPERRASVAPPGFTR